MACFGSLFASRERRWAYSSAVIPGVTNQSQLSSQRQKSPGGIKAHTLSRVQQMRVCLVQRLSELKLCGRDGSVSAVYKLSLNPRLTQP